MRSKFQVIWSKQDDAIAKQQRFEGIFKFMLESAEILD